MEKGIGVEVGMGVEVDTGVDVGISVGVKVAADVSVRVGAGVCEDPQPEMIQLAIKTRIIIVRCRFIIPPAL
jgi:hypothetical protein